jgi:diguanylate cyclase (GGDEF)-like protein/PAS domain S-box-containing protein
MHGRENNLPDSAAPPRALSPLRVLLTVLAVVSLAEVAVMFLLPKLLPSAPPIFQALEDAGLLTLISSPFLWWLVVRPLRNVATAEGIKFRRLLETAPEGIVGADREGRIVLVNAQTQALFGYSRGELLGQPVEILLPERFREAHRGRHQGYFAAPRIPPTRLDLCGVRKEGSEFPVNMILSLLETSAETLVIAIIRDITQRKRAEQDLRQANDRLACSVNVLERRTQEMALLQEMGELLQSCATVEEAYGIFGRYAQRFFPAGWGALCVIARSRNLVEAVTVWGNSPLSERFFAPDDCWALRRGRVHLMADSASVPLCRHMGQALPMPYVCIPMMAQGEALGVLHLQVSDRGSDLPEATSKLLVESSRLAIVVAEQIGLALANLKLRETLRDQSVRDPLTGIFNRRYLEESLNRDLHSAARKQRTVGVIMFDIDHFKHFNDTFGHEAGDTVLRVLGDFLQKRIRGEDIACRYGGEEFTLILPEASLDATRQRAEQLLQEVKLLDLQHRGQALSSITLSMGVAAFPEHGLTAEEILRAADAALYRAKATGRARVVVADKLLTGSDLGSKVLMGKERSGSPGRKRHNQPKKRNGSGYETGEGSKP